MSIRDGVEPPRSPDSETHTQPIPRDPQDPSQPSQDPWPPSWGQAPPPAGAAPDAPAAAEGPGWTPPPAAQGPSWTQAKSPEPPPQGAEAPTDQTRPAWGQGGEGGGGYPTVPGWGAPPTGAGPPSGRRPSRWLAAVVAGVVLLAGGYGISQALDDDPAPAGAGIPVAAPAASPGAAAVTGSGEEPAAAVAKALLPTVVEIRSGASGVGSGFVYDKNGYIMTAAHVVDGVDEVDVRLYDGTRLRGEVLGTDDLNDVGVVKVDRTGLAAAPLAVGQDLQVGQLAIAIGSPFGLAETVTAGIVSSTDRVLPDGREVIQTDAPINPGNSGGVLANRQGRVIGINSAIRPANEGSDGNVGIGFAVPIDLAAKSAAAIVQGKQVEAGYLGVTTSLTSGGQAGALIQEVAPDSPAAQAGLRPGDLVVEVDGQAIREYSELGARIRAHKPGDEVTLKVIRGGSETTITATLTKRPAG
jgi:putative serine protease PepD